MPLTKSTKSAILGMLFGFLAASVPLWGASLRRGNPTAAETQTTIHTGYQRTATIVFENAAGEEVPSPAGYELYGNQIWFDGGNVWTSQDFNQITVTATGAIQQGDFIPGRPMQLEAYVSVPGMSEPIITYSAINLVDPPDINTAILVWGPETLSPTQN